MTDFHPPPSPPRSSRFARAASPHPPCRRPVHLSRRQYRQPPATIHQASSRSDGHRTRPPQARALCVTGPERSPIMPDLPPCADSVPGLVAVNWWGVFMPAGTPKAITDKFHADLVKAMQDAEVKKKFADLGVEAVHSTPEQFVAFMKSETAKYAKLIKEAGIKVE